MKVYHGTIYKHAESIINNGIILSYSKTKLDFAKGFYTTTDLEFAISTAVAKNKKAKHDSIKHEFFGAVLEFEYDEVYAQRCLEYLVFDKVSIEWAQFIINNRNRYEYVEAIKDDFHNLDNKYDIVSGAIADGIIVSLSKNLKVLKTKMNKNDFKAILYNYDTRQISFHTQKSLNCIEYIRCGIINPEEGVEWYE